MCGFLAALRRWLGITVGFHVCVPGVCLSLWACALFISQHTIGVTVHHDYLLHSLTFTASQYFVDLLHFVCLWANVFSFIYLFSCDCKWILLFLFMQWSKPRQLLTARKLLQRLGASTSPCSKYSGFLLHVQTFTALFVLPERGLVHSVQGCHQTHNWL